MVFVDVGIAEMKNRHGEEGAAVEEELARYC